MALDWEYKAKIDEGMVAYRHFPEGFSPRVTIGLPTFNRPEMIKRALASISKQTFREFVLVISDNAGRSPETLAAVKEYAAQLPAVILVAQAENKRSLGNFHYLLTVAETEFFMWLSDDDEMTETYLEDLVGLLDANAQAVASMGYWYRMQNPREGSIRTQSQHGQRNPLARMVRYVAGPTDDTLFYGLYRTDCLRRCSFSAYLFPNRHVLTNFCYLLLFDLLLQGPAVYTQNSGWVDHNYTEKQYNVATACGLKDRLKTLARRINVYGLYCVKACRKNPLLLVPVFAASVYGFSRDLLSAVWRISCRLLLRKP